MLSFGIRCSSGDSQRFSTIILALVEVELVQLMREEGISPEDDPCFGEWLRARREALWSAAARCALVTSVLRPGGEQWRVAL